MGDLKDWFGGTESSSGPVDATPDDVAKLRKNAGSAIMKFFQQGGGPEYTGPLVAGMQPNEQSLLNTLFADANGSTGRQGLINQTMAGNFLPGQGGSNPFLNAAIEAAQRPTFEGLGEVLGRQLPSNFLKAGQTFSPGTFAQNIISQAGGGPTTASGSSAFDRASAIATRGATQQAGDIASKMSSENFENERTRQQQAVQLSQADTELTMKNLQAQALPRLIEDMGIERGIDLFKSRTQELLAALSSLGQFGALTNIANQAKSETQGGIIPGIGNFIGNLPIAPR